MSASKQTEAPARTAQLSIKIDAQLYDKYKTKLKKYGISITEDIENHMRDYVGEMIIQNNIVDIIKVVKDVEELKQAMGELSPGWQQRVSISNADYEEVKSGLVIENEHLKRQLKAMTSQLENLVQTMKNLPPINRE
ncbi:hypothetical protein NIES4071_60850 [Calothrix sp. NIES-4071]|nr:hypothetical protein NIES4071_60850 [Calothrix sp. NIES-4071]BAZ60392.1 hypothetical protein NIES4105_60800 [Calothrix sp. NIES-4105]